MFDKNLILPDSILTEYHPFDIEGFLEGLGSNLTRFSLDGKPVSSFIDDACRAQKLDPRLILTKLQVEQSLLYQKPTQEKLDWAMGYGCTDVGLRKDEFMGFARQVEAAAEAIRSYVTPGEPNYVGDLIDKDWQLGDGTVKCRNLATAALYRYTPWIGDKDFEHHRAPFRNFLFYRVWTGLFGPIPLDEGKASLARAWRIIAPPDNWRDPIIVSDEELNRLEQLAAHLNLVKHKDEGSRKLYLGNAVAKGNSGETSALTFPSGEALATVDETPWSKKGSTYWSPHAALAPPLVQITTRNLGKKLSAHFTLQEFVCHDRSYDYVRVSPLLVEKLEVIRGAAGGSPVQVTSAYRPYPYNAAIKGAAAHSYHIDGLAADISIDGVPIARLGALADSVIGVGGGVGIYHVERFVHVDVSGIRLRW